jgi:hypothetical protein
MSREKQIEEMRAALDAVCDVMPLGECYDVDCEKCKATHLYNAGYRKQAWISVEERLPQVCGVYICCVKTKGGTTWTKTAEFVPEMKMWFGKFGEIKNIVTHWMPLPEPPKGE